MIQNSMAHSFKKLKLINNAKLMIKFAPTIKSTKVYSSIYFKTLLSSVQITEQFKLKFLSSQSER